MKKNSEIRTRFAPSPTGFLHIGGARTAIFNYLLAKKNNGKFILRIEDTDKKRNTDEAVQVLLDNLKWIGLTWDEGPDHADDSKSILNILGDYGPYFQSQRHDIYTKYLDKLIKSKDVYEDQGSFRYKLKKEVVLFNDKICGEVKFNLENEPDITIQRPDGSFTFHFVNVIDDIEMKISHVIRGEDHLINTCKHIQLYKSLSAEIPTFAHIPLTLNENGSKMSKSDEGASINDYVIKGVIPSAVFNYLCFLGWSPKNDEKEIFTKEEFIEIFNFDGFNRNPAKFDFTKCLWMSSQHIMKLSDSQYIKSAKEYLPETIVKNVSKSEFDSALLLVKNKIKTFKEISGYFDIFWGDHIEYKAEILEKIIAFSKSKELISEFESVLSEDAKNVDSDFFDKIFTSIIEKYIIKKGKLMFFSRLIFSGLDGGADLIPMLVLIGRERLLQRLRTLKKVL